MQDSYAYKDLQCQMNKFISRLEELEIENKFLKEQQDQYQYQLIQNVKQIDLKYSKLLRKYLKCLYKYGIYQSCLTNLISQHNKLLDKYDKGMPKLTIPNCIEKYGIIYEDNQIIDDVQIEKIITKRTKLESQEIQTIFFPQKIRKHLSELDSNYTFQTQQSHRCRQMKEENLQTDNSDDTLLLNLTTQRYLEKLQQENAYLMYNDDTVSYPKTIKVDQLLQQNQLQRKSSSQLITERSRRATKNCNNENSTISPSPAKQNNLSGSIIEDRLKKFELGQESGEKKTLSRRRSRAERLKNNDILQ